MFSQFQNILSTKKIRSNRPTKKFVRRHKELFKTDTTKNIDTKLELKFSFPPNKQKNQTPNNLKILERKNQPPLLNLGKSQNTREDYFATPVVTTVKGRQAGKDLLIDSRKLADSCMRSGPYLPGTERYSNSFTRK